MARQQSIQYEEVLELALRLSPSERVAIIEGLAASIRTLSLKTEALHQNDEVAFTDEEIAELMEVEPLSPAEIVARGLTGTWADMDIGDGAEWVNEQKLRRKEHPIMKNL